jgi:NAD(P)H dehydrogenase (quinone)
MILVTAATGELGNHVIRKLLKRVPPQRVAVAVREPRRAHHFAAQGIAVRRADYDDPVEAWVPVLFDVKHLLLISSPEFDVDKRVAQHQRVIDAAASLHIPQVAYTSFLGAGTPRPGGFNAHYLTERAIEQAGLGYTFLRNPFYTEAVLPKAFLEESIKTGVVTSAAGTHPVNSATRADLAEAAAAVLTTDGHEKQAYELTGPPWTYPQLAAILAQWTALPIEVRDVPLRELGSMAFVAELIAEGYFERSTPQLEQLIGRPPMDLEQYVKNVLGPVKDELVRESVIAGG